ncbi:hypothetical protein DOE78_03620 [Bacillus sp. Y1]|nr:hypothetical protein DOE78_03620 [Bacillus sp. Y1]
MVPTQKKSVVMLINPPTSNCVVNYSPSMWSAVHYLSEVIYFNKGVHKGIHIGCLLFGKSYEFVVAAGDVNSAAFSKYLRFLYLHF